MRRSFGPSSDNASVNTAAEETKAKEEESTDLDIPQPASFFENKTVKKVISIVKKPVVFIPSIAAFLIVTFLVIFVGKMDMGYGAKSPELAAYNFTQLASQQSDEVWDYMPGFVRKSKQGSSAVMWGLDETSYIPLSNVKLKSVQVIRDSIPSIKQGYDTFYHDSMNIKDAALVSVMADITADDGTVTNITFDIVCVKSGWRWYVYTGSDLDFVNFPQGVIKTARIPVDPTGAIELRPYDGALADLKLGKVTIDSNNFRMPVKYKNIRNLFSLDSEMIDEGDRMLSKNMILKFLPVMYDGQPTDCFIVDIANPGEDTVDLTDGYVTTLQVRRNADEKTVAMILPGNVVFGTSKSDLFTVYGELEPYDGQDDDLNSFNYDQSNMYQVRIDDDNEYNWIYFVFDSDDKLSAVEWRYYDMESVLDQ